MDKYLPRWRAKYPEDDCYPDEVITNTTSYASFRLNCAWEDFVKAIKNAISTQHR